MQMLQEAVNMRGIIPQEKHYAAALCDGGLQSHMQQATRSPHALCLSSGTVSSITAEWKRSTSTLSAGGEGRKAAGACQAAAAGHAGAEALHRVAGRGYSLVDDALLRVQRHAQVFAPSHLLVQLLLVVGPLVLDSLDVLDRGVVGKVGQHLLLHLRAHVGGV